jgi:protein SCO1/2
MLRKDVIYLRKIIGITILMSIIFLTACGKDKVELMMESDVAPFSATTQDGDSFTNKDLQGEWWIADFIFTNCTTVCPPMTSNMAKVQSQLAEEDIEAELVSFSVDPDNDTPEVLKAYGQDHGADFNNWTFLTGYKFEEIQKLSIESFKSDVQPPLEGDDQVGHGTRFFLVNPDGVAVNSYIGTDKEQMEQLVEDLKILQK